MTLRCKHGRTQAIVLALALFGTGGAEADERRKRFLADRHCVIHSILTSIYQRGPRTTSRDRFVTLSIADAAQHYVQCIFQNDDTEMFCEASYGVYRYRDGQGQRLDMIPDSVAALKALGFTLPDANGNFVREVELGSPPKLDAVATLMLAALYDAYRADASSTVEWNAPKGDVDVARCGRAFTRAYRRG